MSDKLKIAGQVALMVGGVALAAVGTVYTYKVFGKIVAKEVVKLLV